MGTLEQETALMSLIRDQMGAPIRDAVKGTAIPEAFVAALTANESGGNPAASRFEAAEQDEFLLVLDCKRGPYQGITAAQLQKAIRGDTRSLVAFCTSWGPTQIMGWHAIKEGYPLSELLTIPRHFYHAVQELLDFAREFRMMLPPAPFPDGVAFPDQIATDLFHCWNAGAPTRPTTDPAYSADGLERMKIYLNLSA